MHIYLQWDPWVIGITPPKKNIHMNTKPLDLVTVGQAWDSCPRPWISKPQPQLYAKHHRGRSGALPRGLPSCFCSLEGKTEQWCFLRVTLRVETIGVWSSNEPLPNMQCTRGHIPMEPAGSTSVLYLPQPLLHILIRCTHFRQPLLLLCQTEAQTNAWGTLVWSDVIVDKD